MLAVGCGDGALVRELARSVPSMTSLFNLVTRVTASPGDPAPLGPRSAVVRARTGADPQAAGDLLAEYDIRSTPIRFGEPIGQVRGYYRSDFTDAWARYCPPPRGTCHNRHKRPRPAQARDG